MGGISAFEDRQDLTGVGRSVLLRLEGLIRGWWTQSRSSGRRYGPAKAGPSRINAAPQSLGHPSGSGVPRTCDRHGLVALVISSFTHRNPIANF